MLGGKFELIYDKMERKYTDKNAKKQICDKFYNLHLSLQAI